MATPTPPKKILLAEDVRAISLRVSHALETHGYLVRVAEDGEECLEQIEEFKPDLLVLDLIMPKMNGLEVLRHLRAQQATQIAGPGCSNLSLSRCVPCGTTH